MEEDFSHEQCREFTYELIQWIVARTMIGYTKPLSDRLSRWAIWYLPRHCSHCGACGDDAHITESGVCDSCLLLEEKDPSTTPAASLSAVPVLAAAAASARRVRCAQLAWLRAWLCWARGLPRSARLVP